MDRLCTCKGFSPQTRRNFPLLLEQFQLGSWHSWASALQTPTLSNETSTGLVKSNLNAIHGLFQVHWQQDYRACPAYLQAKFIPARPSHVKFWCCSSVMSLTNAQSVHRPVSQKMDGSVLRVVASLCLQCSPPRRYLLTYV